MQTRSQKGIHKPKIPFIGYTNLILPTTLPTSATQALQIPVWNGTYSCLNECDCSKWIFKIKHNSDGLIQRYKACLVAQGFTQTRGVDFFETFSPVVKPTNIKIILTLATSLQWHTNSLNISKLSPKPRTVHHLFAHKI